MGSLAGLTGGVVGLRGPEWIGGTSLAFSLVFMTRRDISFEINLWADINYVGLYF